MIKIKLSKIRFKLFALLLVVYSPGFSQNYFSELDSIKQALGQLTNDKDVIEALIMLSSMYSTVSYDSAVSCGQQALSMAEQINYNEGRIAAFCVLGVANTRGGNLSKALEYGFKGLQIAKENGFTTSEALCYYTIGKAYYFLKDYSNAIKFCSLARELNVRYSEKRESLIKVQNDPFIDNELVLGEAFMDNNQLDSALVYFRRLQNESTDSSWKAIVSIFLGDALFRKGEKEQGLTLLKEAFKTKQNQGDDYSRSWASSILARCYKELNIADSSIFYAKDALYSSQRVGFKDRMLQSSLLLAEEFEKIDTLQAFPYLKQAFALNDELFGKAKVFELQKTLADAQQYQQELEKRQIDYENKVRFYFLLAGFGIIIGVALVLYYNNRKEKKAKLVLENTLHELKSTQSQLIQAEKMASLGELTAGIAHEIQNPLNFVNNFSEVNLDLIRDLKSEIKHNYLDEVNALATDIETNSEKINHHGKRAADIVKGMLQHSRTSSGQKELTDINAVADEYLRLAYHGLRAKDKSFNAKFETHLDPTLPKLNVIPQDIGRVLLNLINNAFYAVSEKLKVESQKSGSGYEPSVTVSTKNLGDKIEISVKDNGNGIPDSIKEKIFQPFFTTKPTGQGTGLGLSLSYDIVKAHGGDITLVSTQEEGTQFTIVLNYTR